MINNTWPSIRHTRIGHYAVIDDTSSCITTLCVDMFRSTYLRKRILVYFLSEENLLTHFNPWTYTSNRQHDIVSNYWCIISPQTGLPTVVNNSMHQLSITILDYISLMHEVKYRPCTHLWRVIRKSIYVQPSYLCCITVYVIFTHHHRPCISTIHIDHTFRTYTSITHRLYTSTMNI